MKFRVLVVDDEPSITRSLRRVLDDQGYDVEIASTGQAGLELAEQHRPHIILLDLKLPDASGLDLIPKLHEIDRASRVILLTAFGDTKLVVSAMKQGASDFLRKPYDLDELMLAIETAGRSFSREAQLTVYRRRDRERYDKSELVWRSRVMGGIWDLVQKAALSESTGVLITGESGTGKELVARALHFESARQRAPFMELNCSGFQETLIENELFGHERGAFTGASQTKRGLVELSDGGTLFLDEVGEMPLLTQGKLLRFLEDRSFRRVGGNADIHVDIRIIAATNVDLARRIQESRFRMDLFYRLQIVSIHLPPLRQRGEDVLHLAEHFLRRFAGQFHKAFRTISPEAAQVFLGYAWPGNVRELRNLLERIVLLEDAEVLEPSHLPPELRAAPRRVAPASDLSGATVDLRPLREVEDEHIRRILAHCEGNKSRAARMLGLSRQGLLDRLKRSEAVSVYPS